MTLQDTASDLDRLNLRIIACRRCPRLRTWCEQVAREKRRAYADDAYWGRPVPNFGDPQARLLIVGLAPGAHGANRTGRMFTGDRSGEFLYAALHRQGFASQPTATACDDGLVLGDCLITASCHCAPPDNKPTGDELHQCSEWLERTVEVVRPSVYLALGGIAFRSVIDLARSRGWYSGRLPKFAHGAHLELDGGRHLLASYHVSQQNTFTGRLTEQMLDEVLQRTRDLIRAGSADTEALSCEQRVQ
jgi:uracil-DNA glycosylase